MKLEDVNKKLLDAGYNLSDFEIKKIDGNISVKPLSSFEQRKISKQETEPLYEEMSDVASMVGDMLLESCDIVDVVTELILMIGDLQMRLEELEGK